MEGRKRERDREGASEQRDGGNKRSQGVMSDTKSVKLLPFFSFMAICCSVCVKVAFKRFIL